MVGPGTLAMLRNKDCRNLPTSFQFKRWRTDECAVFDFCDMTVEFTMDELTGSLATLQNAGWNAARLAALAARHRASNQR